jgi:hypothetical protein
VCSRKKKERGKVFNEGTQYRKKKKGEKLGYLWSLSKKRKGINVGKKKAKFMVPSLMILVDLQVAIIEEISQ